PHKTVLYAACFFKRLSPVDFEQIVRLLLGDRTTMVEKERQIVTESGEIKIIKEKEIKRLKEMWTENPDRILRECRLKTFRTESQTEYIEYSSPYLGNEIKKYIAEEFPIYLRRQFEPIQKKGLLFETGVSPGITDNVIRLSVEMALVNPVYYGENWLKEFIMQLKHHFDEEFSLPAENELEAVLKVIESIANDAIKAQFYARLSTLIREMLNHPNLREMIERFLKNLIGMKHHDIVLDIVWQLGKRLRFAPHFDLMYWLKRLLDEGEGKVREKAYRHLLTLAVQSKFQVYELLDTLKNWLPRPEDQYKHYSGSLAKKYALIFIFDYCGNTALKLPPGHYGAWPSRYPLFHPMQKLLQKDNNTAAQKIRELLAWLLHPGIQLVFDNDFSKKNFSAIHSMASLFEIWALVLLGKDQNKTHRQAETLLDILIEQLTLLLDQLPGKTGRAHKRALLKLWGAQRGIYRQKINKLPLNQKDKRKELSCRYKIVTKLIAKLKRGKK
ncbi:MAG: hypothetical protein GY757_23800, partial [bacterium]|nr:hypothetical protein [bacterium]